MTGPYDPDRPSLAPPDPISNPTAPGQSNADQLATLIEAVVTAIGQDASLALRIHQAADVDGSAQALHHTLGTLAGQAAAGNHAHTAESLGLRNWYRSYTGVATDGPTATEVKDTHLQDVAFDVRANRDYTFRASIGVGVSAGPYTGEIHIRYETAVTGTTTVIPSPTTASPLLLSKTFAGERAGGPGQQDVLLNETLRAGLALPAGIPLARYRIGVFAARTSGTGLAIYTHANSRRAIEVTEKISTVG